MTGLVDGINQARPVGVCEASFLEFLLQALPATILRETWLSGHLGYVAELCINVRGAFLVIREACADLDSFKHGVKMDGRLATNSVT